MAKNRIEPHHRLVIVADAGLSAHSKHHRLVMAVVDAAGQPEH